MFFPPHFNGRPSSRPLTSKSDSALGALRTPWTLWYPSGARVSVRSLLRTSWHFPNATSHTTSSRVPSSVWRIVYFKQHLREEERGGGAGDFVRLISPLREFKAAGVYCQGDFNEGCRS